jgi:hypothetical protein
VYAVFYNPFLPAVKPHRAASRSEPKVPHVAFDLKIDIEVAEIV